MCIKSWRLKKMWPLTYRSCSFIEILSQTSKPHNDFFTVNSAISAFECRSFKGQHKNVRCTWKVLPATTRSLEIRLQTHHLYVNKIDLTPQTDFEYWFKVPDPSGTVQVSFISVMPGENNDLPVTTTVLPWGMVLFSSLLLIKSW